MFPLKPTSPDLKNENSQPEGENNCNSHNLHMQHIKIKLNMKCVYLIFITEGTQDHSSLFSFLRCGVAPFGFGGHYERSKRVRPSGR